MKEDLAVVYMVAGMARRFEGRPKWLVKVGPKGESFIQYSLKQALSAGVTKIIFIVGERTKDLFKEEFGESYAGVPVQYALQSYDPEKRDRPWGTLDALCSAKKFLDCPFIICSGDDLYGETAFKILAKHLRTKDTSATVGYKLKNVLSEDGTVNRGTFEIDSEGKVKSIKEVFEIEKSNINEKGLSEETLCSMLFFGLQPDTLEPLEKNLEEFKNQNQNNREIESLLPNEIGKLIENNMLTMQAYSTDDTWIGITNPEDEEKVRQALKKLTR